MIESIADYVILTNTGFMGAEEAGTRQPFSKPILSFLGSRERFNAMVIPHSGGSDHEVFCEGVIGVPGVALINNPDPYIHSTDDDLQNIDPTQLKRNAFIVAAATLFVANAGDEDVPLLDERNLHPGSAEAGQRSEHSASVSPGEESRELCPIL